MRANPEIVTEMRRCVADKYGTVNDIDTQTSVTLSERTYSSSNTPGFPGVTPLPFRGYWMDWRRRTYGTLRYDAKSSATNYNYGFGPSTFYAVAQASIEQHVPATLRFNTSAEYRARSKVISDIQRIKVNVAQNIAEYRQVGNMFSTNARRIANAYRALRRGDVSGMAKHIPVRKRHQQNLLRRGPLDVRREAPSIWLELQYGWNPLLGDIYTGMTEFYRRVESGYPIRARGTGSFTESYGTKLDSDSGWVSFRDSTTRTFKNLYIIEYEVDHSQLANLDDWGVTNPALLAWELVPYSFVVDWFIPVGDWLSQVGYSLGLYFKRGMRTALADAFTIRNFRPKSGATFSLKVSGQDTFRTTRMRREVLSSFPSPGKPRLDPNGLRGKRIANALSLLALAFDRRV